MKVGTLVCLVGTDDGPMPPIGSVGVIVSPFDEMGDCDVEFPDYPCPISPDKSWVAHRSWLIPLPGNEAPMSIRMARAALGAE